MTAGGDGPNTATLQVTVEAATLGGVVVVTVAGEVDYETAGDLRAALSTSVEASPAGIVVDLAGVRFLDSSGLGVIVGGWQEAERAGVDYVLRGVPANIADQFEMTGLSRVLTFDDGAGPVDLAS